MNDTPKVDNIESRVNSIFVEFLGYLPYSEDSSIEVEAKTDAIKSLIALIQEQQKALLKRLDEQWINTDPYELFDKIRGFIEAECEQIKDKLS